MWSIVKLYLGSWTFWIAALAVVSFVGGVYLIANGRGYDRGLQVGLDRLEAHHERMQELAAKENQRVIEYVTIREPIITERIVYVDKVRTEYEQIIRDNPDTCYLDSLRAERFNQIGKAPDSLRTE